MIWQRGSNIEIVVYDIVFYIFVRVWAMDLATHQTFDSSTFWVARVETFQDTLLEFWRNHDVFPVQ